MAKTRSLRQQFELILNYTQSLSRELAQLPPTHPAIVSIVKEMPPREREELDDYLGKLGIFFGHLREDFITLRRALKG
jgi:hypothetical protein